MKSKLVKFFLVLALFFTSFIPAHALIINDGDLNQGITKLQQLYDHDFLSMVNKSELIGYRLSNYNMLTNQYKNNAFLAIEELKKNLKQIQLVRNSSEFSDTDKQMQINVLYQDCDRVLYDIDNKTSTYLYSCRYHMPTITFQRYVKHFLEYYNSLHLTNNTIYVSTK